MPCYPLPHARQVDAILAQQAIRGPATLVYQANQDVLGADMIVLETFCLGIRHVEYPLSLRREGQLAIRLLGGAALDHVVPKIGRKTVERDPHALEHLCRGSLAESHQAHQQVFGAN